jgi:hypothetical protein
MQTKFVLEPTNNINCCNVNSLGYECYNPNPGYGIGINDEYGSSEVYQAVFLIISNLFLLLPAFKSFLMNDYCRTFINISAMIVSSLYHLCKTNSKRVRNVCLVQFCILKNLDYSTSITLLISLIFFLLPFIYDIKNDKFAKQKGVKYKKTTRFNFLEPYILLCYFIFTYITISGSVFCSNKYILELFGGLIGSAFIISIIGNIIITKILKLHKYYFNKKILFVGFFLAGLALVLFCISDYLPISSYWITHSLWHILGALAQIVLLNIRKRNPIITLL